MADLSQYGTVTPASGSPAATGGPDLSEYGTVQPAQPKTLLDHLQEYYQQTALLHPKESAQGLMDTVLHPLNALKAYGEQNQALADKATESFKKGDYSEAARHSLDYLLQVVPGLGSRLDTAGTKAGQGDYGGAAADTAAIATDYLAGPKAARAVLDVATEPGAAGRAVSAVTAPIKNAAATVADTALSPGTRDVVGIFSPRLKNALGVAARARDVLAKSAATEAPTIPVGAPVAAEPAPSPLPESRQIALPPKMFVYGAYGENWTDSPAIITPAPADTSGVIPGWKPTILDGGEAPPAADSTAAPAPAAPQPPALTLNDIAKQTLGKEFDTLGPAAKEFVQQAFDKYNRPAQSAPVAIPGRVAPVPAPVPAAQTQPAAPDPAIQLGGGGPLRPPLAPVRAPDPPSAWIDQNPSGYGPSRQGLYGNRSEPIDETGAGGVGRGGPHAVYRAAMVDRFVNEMGGTHNLPTTESDWHILADKLGEDHVPSPATRLQIEAKLNQRMVAGTETPGSNKIGPQGAAPSDVPNWVKNAKDPTKALKAAEKLKQAIQ